MRRPFGARRRSATGAFGTCTHGSIAVEFAIIGGVLVLLLIGTLELGRVLWAQNQLSYLADQAARQVMIDPAVTSAELQVEMRSGFTAGTPGALSLHLDRRMVLGEPYRVLSVNAPFTLFIPGFVGTITLAATRRIPVM